MATSSVPASNTAQHLDSRRYRQQRQRNLVVLYSLVAVISIVTMAPFFFMLSGSFMERGELFSLEPHFLPKRPSWDNYRSLLETTSFLTWMRNSLTIAVAQTLGVMFFSSLAGFVFAKRRFPGRDTLFFLALVTTLLPGGQLTIIPFYLMMAKIGWINTFWPVVLPFLAPAFQIFLMRQYIATSIPDELIDAAKIDGCGLFSTYWRIVVPLSVPGLVVVGISQFIAAWNEYLYGLMILREDSLRTLPVGLAAFSQTSGGMVPYSMIFAGVVLSTLPMIVLYLLSQRQLRQGLLSGAVRG
jgi:ABC-type glycerol-3-phosphate transport system permease component